MRFDRCALQVLKHDMLQSYILTLDLVEMFTSDLPDIFISGLAKNLTSD